MPMRHSLALLGTLLVHTVVASDYGGWTQMISDGSSSLFGRRAGHSVLTSSTSNEVNLVLYGGADAATFYNDVWMMRLGASPRCGSIAGS